MDPTTVTTNPDIHKPLITALATFYTLLVDLRYIPPAWLIQPSPETGRHPTNLINAAAAARRNGFGPSAIDLAYQIPYIVDEDVKLNPDTQPLCYLTRLGGAVQPLSNSEQRDADLADEWEYARDPTFQGRDDTWAGSNVLVLTRGQVYGVVLVYDIDEQTIREWKICNGLDWRKTPAYPMTSWQNPLYVWVRDFLSLKTLPLHGNVIVQRDEEELVPRGAADGRYRLYLERSLEGYRKERSLREVYLQCGWRVDADGEMQQGQGGRVWESLEEARKVAGGGFQPREFEIRRQEWFDRLWPEDAREKCSGCLEH